MACRGPHTACSYDSVKSRGEEDLESGEADNNVVVWAILANSIVTSKAMGELLCQDAGGGFGEVVGGIGCVDVEFRVFLG